MRKILYYPILAAELSKRGIAKKQIADALKINYKTFYNKWNGFTPFTWPEVCTIRDTFFSDMALENLFTIGK